MTELLPKLCQIGDSRIRSDQAHASIRLQPPAGQAAAIAQEMTKTGGFFFWWD